MPTVPAKTAPNVGTWNIHATNSDDAIDRGVTALVKSGADVIGLQELSNDADQRRVTALVRRLGWGATTRNSAVTIIYDARKYTVKESFVLVHKGGEPWEDGTAGDKSIYKIIMRLDLTSRTGGGTSHILNSHVVPGIEKGGQLRDDVPRRMAVYDAQIDALVKLFNQLAGTGNPIVATGDFNVAWDKPAGRDLEDRMAKGGAVCNWSTLPDVDTHKDRVIDYVWYRNARARGQTIPGKFGSDHTAVWVDLEPLLGDYIVDPAKVATFLFGLDHSDPDNKDKAKRREPGYRINTGVDILYIRNDQDGKTYPWLLTEAGYRYRMDYLKAVA